MNIIGSWTWKGLGDALFTYIERVLPIRKLIYICHSWPKKRQDFLPQRRKPVNHMMRLFSGRNFKAVNAVQKLK